MQSCSVSLCIQPIQTGTIHECLCPDGSFKHVQTDGRINDTKKECLVSCFWRSVRSKPKQVLSLSEIDVKPHQHSAIPMYINTCWRTYIKHSHEAIKSMSTEVRIFIPHLPLHASNPGEIIIWNDHCAHGGGLRRLESCFSTGSDNPNRSNVHKMPLPKDPDPMLLVNVSNSLARGMTMWLLHREIIGVHYALI